MAWIWRIIVLGLVMASAQAAEPDPAAAICAKTACRAGGFSIKVSVDKEHFTSLAVTHSPYVEEDGTILIFPGETLVFRLPAEGDKLGAPQFVAEYAPQMPAERDTPDSRSLPKLSGALPADVLAPFPTGSFVISYGQRGREPSTYLIMAHNLPQTLKLDAVMMIIRPGKYEPHATSTCPLMSKVFGFEHWPHPIGPMLLKNIRVPTGGMVCD